MTFFSSKQRICLFLQIYRELASFSDHKATLPLSSNVSLAACPPQELDWRERAAKVLRVVVVR